MEAFYLPAGTRRSAAELADLGGDVRIVGLRGEDRLELLQGFHPATAGLEDEAQAVAKAQAHLRRQPGNREAALELRDGGPEIAALEQAASEHVGALESEALVAGRETELGDRFV